MQASASLPPAVHVLQQKAQLPERMKLPAIAGIVEGHELYLPSSQDTHYT